jgi:uncharacterized protein
VVVVWDGPGIANDSQPYANSHAWIMRLADGKVVDGKVVDGKVVDGTASHDSISLNDLWTRVQP